MPKLKSLYEKYKDKGFIVIAISLDDDKKRWINAIIKDGQLWPQFCELKTWTYNSMYNKWGISWLPYNFLIDRQGKLSDKEINIDKLEEKILNLQ
jgi:glutathione peroxidase-family protein